MKKIDSTYFVEVIDPESDSEIEAKKKRKENSLELTRILGGKVDIEPIRLLATRLAIKKCITEFIEGGSSNVIVDITSFPKRFFFPFIRLLVESDNIQNLIVTYTLPETYTKDNLASDPLPWDYLPLFQRIEHPSKKVEHAIVGVGFLPFGLPSLLKHDYGEAQVRLVFPFPPGPPHYQRTWDFVRLIEESSPLRDDKQIVRVNALDAPGCYRHICAITENGAGRAIFAPYGPKTHSLAMCLFATTHDCDVFYTQPQHYHPDYSIGMKHQGGMPETYAFYIKLNGKNLYSG